MEESWFYTRRGNCARCLGSLLKSVYEAGGTCTGFTPKKLSQMCALELIETIGPNNIRFVYDAKEKK